MNTIFYRCELTRIIYTFVTRVSNQSWQLPTSFQPRVHILKSVQYLLPSTHFSNTKTKAFFYIILFVWPSERLLEWPGFTAKAPSKKLGVQNISSWILLWDLRIFTGELCRNEVRGYVNCVHLLLCFWYNNLTKNGMTNLRFVG